MELGLKKIPVFPLTCRKKLGSVGRKIFLFFVIFLFVRKKIKNVYWDYISSTIPANIHIMKFRTSRKLKNIIISINFAILTFCF